MSCPDWQDLCDRREAGPGDGPGWQAAVRHLDGCPDCQGEALGADPTLLFRRLPALVAGADEVEAMKRAVAGMRRGETIERRAPARRRRLLRVAALAAVLLSPILRRGGRPPAPTLAEPPLAASAMSVPELDWLPLVEAVDPSYGSIIQMVDDDIAVVVVMPWNAGGEPEADVEAAYPDA